MPAKESVTQSGKLYRELFGLLLIFWALFLLLSLVTYSPADPSFNQVVSKGHKLHNGAGLVGAYLGGLLAELFGVVAYAFPLGFAVAGVKRFVPTLPTLWWRWLGFVLFSLCLASIAEAVWLRNAIALGGISGGGYLGRALHHVGTFYLRPLGGGLLWTFVFVCSLQLMSGLTWQVIFCRAQKGLATLVAMLKATLKERGAKPQQTVTQQRRQVESIDLPEVDEQPDESPEPKARKTTARTGPFNKKRRKQAEAESLELPLDGPDLGKARPGKKNAKPTSGGLPSLDLLPRPQGEQPPPPMEELEEQAGRLTTCLADFNVQGEVQHISPGPVVTMFEYKPAPGVKISRIAGLSDDLALALKALAVRIEAPIPGKDSVGIEIPSKTRQTVLLHEILASKAFANSGSLLTLALGQDIAGSPKVADLAKMPHLLVAGATGAGKSVCLNSILLSFLFKARPEELKLLLVDPKRIELSVYQDLPHLVHPVVTEMELAKNALDWAVAEMDSRYQAMSRMGARNIEGYNAKLRNILAQNDGDLPEELAGLQHIPYLVIVIDELADLMLTAAKEVEMSVVRLAQLARAAGIHMILATQRPSVDVVTGLIKANFPCRISFQVTSRHDSRTILDQVGAEYLLGKGDMLFKPGGGRLQRLHGAFVSDEDVASVASWWKAQQKPEYKVDFAEVGSDDAGSLEGAAGDLDNDTMYKEAVAFVQSQGKASISLLQRRFRIGFNRSARYMEQMELDGIVGPADGSKPRPVLKGPGE